MRNINEIQEIQGAIFWLQKLHEILEEAKQTVWFIIDRFDEVPLFDMNNEGCRSKEF